MIESIALILTGIGLTASIVYYANILNNANKTRQATILMNLYTYQGSSEFQDAVQVFSNACEGMEIPIDPEEFVQRNGPPDPLNDVWKSVFKIIWHANGLGVMVETGYADFNTVNKMWGHQMTWYWQILHRLVDYEREYFNQPQYFEWAEYLHNRIENCNRTKMLCE